MTSSSSSSSSSSFSFCYTAATHLLPYYRALCASPKSALATVVPLPDLLNRASHKIPYACEFRYGAGVFNDLLSCTTVFRRDWAFYEGVLSLLGLDSISSSSSLCHRNSTSGRMYAVVILTANDDEGLPVTGPFMDRYGIAVHTTTGILLDPSAARNTVVWLTKQEKVALLILLLWDSDLLPHHESRVAPPSLLPLLLAFNVPAKNLYRNDSLNGTRLVPSCPVFNAATLYMAHAAESSSSTTTTTDGFPPLGKSHAMLFLMGLVNIFVKCDINSRHWWLGVVKTTLHRLQTGEKDTRVRTVHDYMNHLDAFERGVPGHSGDTFFARMAQSPLYPMFFRLMEFVTRLYMQLTTSSFSYKELFSRLSQSNVFEHSVKSLQASVFHTRVIPTSYDMIGLNSTQLGEALVQLHASTVLRAHEVLAQCVDIADQQLYLKVKQRLSAGGYVFYLFSQPQLNAVLIDVMLHQHLLYIGVPSSSHDQIIVDYCYDPVTACTSLLLGGNARTMYVLNTINWCVMLSQRRYQQDQPLSEFQHVKPYHLACLMDWHSSERRYLARPLMGALFALFGGQAIDFPRLVETDCYKTSVQLLINIGANMKGCCAPLTDTQRTDTYFVADIATVLLLNSFFPVIVHVSHWAEIRKLLLLPETQHKFQHQTVYEHATKVGSGIIVSWQVGRDSDKPLQDRRVFFVDDAQLMTASRDFVLLTSQQQSTLLATAQELLQSGDTAQLVNGWRLLSLVAVVVPCTINYANQIIPRPTTNAPLTEVGRAFSTPGRMHPCVDATSSSSSSSSATSAAVTSSSSSSSSQSSSSSSSATTATGLDATVLQARRALLAMTCAAMGRYPMLRDAYKNKQQHFQEGDALLWLDRSMSNKGIVFTLHPNHPMPDAHDSALFLPITSDYGCAFPHSTIALIDRHRENLAQKYTDEVVRIISVGKSSSSSSSSSTKTVVVAPASTTTTIRPAAMSARASRQDVVVSNSTSFPIPSFAAAAVPTAAASSSSSSPSSVRVTTTSASSSSSPTPIVPSFMTQSLTQALAAPLASIEAHLAQQRKDIAAQQQQRTLRPPKRTTVGPHSTAAKRVKETQPTEENDDTDEFVQLYH